MSDDLPSATDEFVKGTWMNPDEPSATDEFVKGTR